MAVSPDQPRYSVHLLMSNIWKTRDPLEFGLASEVVIPGNAWQTMELHAGGLLPPDNKAFLSIARGTGCTGGCLMIGGLSRNESTTTDSRTSLQEIWDCGKPWLIIVNRNEGLYALVRRVTVPPIPG